jgi:hypothetical protein
VNQKIIVNGVPVTVVGVTQKGFFGTQVGRNPDIFVPMTMKAQMTPNWNGLDNHKDYWMKLIGRLKPGVSRAQAQAGLLVTYRPLLEAELPQHSG